MSLDAFSRPGTYNITVVSGDSWRKEITVQTKTAPRTYVPVDLSAYTAQADALVEPFSPESLAAAKLRKEAQDLIRDLVPEDA